MGADDRDIHRRSAIWRSSCGSQPKGFYVWTMDECNRPRRQNVWQSIGGGNHIHNRLRDPNKRTLKEVMKEGNEALVEKGGMTATTKDETGSSRAGMYEKKLHYQN